MFDIFLILFEEKASMPLWVGITPDVTQQLARWSLYHAHTGWKTATALLPVLMYSVFIILPHWMLQNFKLRVQFRTFGFIRLKAKKNLFCCFVVKLFV